MDNVTMRSPRKLAMKPPDLSPKKRHASRMTDPATPSPDSKRVRADMKVFEEAIMSTIKESRSPARCPSPSKLMFLTKDSNTTQFAAWDVEGRLGELDSQFKKVQDSMNSMISDKELMDERVEMYKKRSESIDER